MPQTSQKSQGFLNLGPGITAYVRALRGSPGGLEGQHWVHLGAALITHNGWGVGFLVGCKF